MKKYMIFALFILMLFVQCKEQKKQKQIKSPNQVDDSVQNTIRTDSIIKTEDFSISFDSLRRKFKYQISNELQFPVTQLSSYYDPKIKLYHFSHQDLRTLQYEEKNYSWSETNFPNIIPFSHKYMKNGILQLFFVHYQEGGFRLFLITYKNEKIISSTEEPLAAIFADGGTTISCKTRIMSDGLFFTTYKLLVGDILSVYDETITKIDQNGIISQSTKKLMP